MSIVDGWMSIVDGWMSIVDGWMDRQIDGCIDDDGWMDELMTSVYMDGQLGVKYIKNPFFKYH